MKEIMRVPTLGESVNEAVVSDILVNAGDVVDKDQIICELETDKVTIEVSAPFAGVIEKIYVEAGDSVKVDAPIATILPEGEAKAKPEPTPAPEPVPEPVPAPKVKSEVEIKAGNKNVVKPTRPKKSGTANKVVTIDNRLMKEAAKPAPKKEEPVASPPTPPEKETKIIVEDTVKMVRTKPEVTTSSGSSSAKSVAKQSSATSVSSANKGLRISKDNYLQNQNTSSANMIMQAQEWPDRDLEEGEEKIRMTRLRKTIARRLKDAQNIAAILTTFNEIDMSYAFDLRKKEQEEFTRKHGVKLGFMGLFVRATCLALKEYPYINSEIAADNIILKEHSNIGVAVGTDRGLVVPVLKKAEKKSVSEIEKDIKAFAEAAKNNKLSPSDMQGGSFTITNGGVYGSLFSTPIINPPQSAILGMHSINVRPVVLENGGIAARPMMYVALSYDHRIVDGKEAVSFLKHIKELIESPEQLLKEV